MCFLCSKEFNLTPKVDKWLQLTNTLTATTDLFESTIFRCGNFPDRAFDATIVRLTKTEINSNLVVHK